MKFKQAIDLDRNKYGLTDNGAVTLKSSSDPVLDLFFLIGASRGKNIDAVFEAAYNVDPVLTTKVALWARDCRGGAGEREIFRSYLRWLQGSHRDTLLTIIESGKIQELGRWDDLLSFTSDILIGYAACYQIGAGLSNEKTVGLVAKWMPRQGSIAHKLAEYFHVSPRNWRKLLVRSTNVVEQKMCAKEWESINFEHVPSLAASRYQKAFTKRAPEQYQAYKNALVKGTAKVNASTLYPYDVVKAAWSGDEIVAEAQWNALPNYLGENGGILPIIDVSGSMDSPISGMTTAMDVAVSLGLYVALRQQGDFHRVVMNFSGESDIIHLKSTGLRNLSYEVRGMHWGMNTNLSAAFANLLEFGVANGILNEEMPKTILIISDMEFDACGRLTNYNGIKKAYRTHGYDLPNIVFWNVNGRQGNVPVSTKKEGVALVSGFSPSIMRSVLSAKNVTPRDIMLETVDVERYTI